MNGHNETIWDLDEATVQEWELYKKMVVLELEGYFDDMLFKGGSTYDFIKVTKYNKVSGKTIETYERPDELEYFTLDAIKIKTDKLSDRDGYYNPDKHLICISEEMVNDTPTLVHEMTHMYESLINELPLYFHDTLLESLRLDLKEKVAGLDEAIKNYSHIVYRKNNYEEGGLHDTLFLLKCIDLDIRLNLPFGTVFGYKTENVFEHLKMKEQS